MNPIERGMKPEVYSNSLHSAIPKTSKPSLAKRVLKKVAQFLASPFTMPVKFITKRFNKELDQFYREIINETHGDPVEMYHAERMIESLFTPGKKNQVRHVELLFQKPDVDNIRSVPTGNSEPLTLGIDQVVSIQEPIMDQFAKDFHRSVYVESRKVYNHDGDPLELLASIRNKLFPETDDINGVSYQIAWIMTQGSVADALTKLLAKGTFGTFPIQNTAGVTYVFEVFDNPKSVKIHIESIQRVFPDLETFNNLQYADLDVQYESDRKRLAEMKKNRNFVDVRMEIDIRLDISNGNIDWDGAKGKFTFSELR